MSLKIVLIENQSQTIILSSMDELVSYYAEQVEIYKSLQTTESKFFNLIFIFEEESFQFKWRLQSNDQNTYDIFKMLKIYMKYFANNSERKIYKRFIVKYGK